MGIGFCTVTGMATASEERKLRHQHGILHVHNQARNCLDRTVQQSNGHGNTLVQKTSDGRKTFRRQASKTQNQEQIQK